ncbi:hypothetical protein FB451DRAFT_1162033 [Mycena latifolia]|nr:hypothetical protein FB451DRAFT_1162033 [Mycena latifolia]
MHLTSAPPVAPAPPATPKTSTPHTPPHTPPTNTPLPSSPSVTKLMQQLARTDPLGPDFEEPEEAPGRGQRVRKPSEDPVEIGLHAEVSEDWEMVDILKHGLAAATSV